MLLSKPDGSPKKLIGNELPIFFDSFSKILLKYLHFMAFPFIFGDYSAIHKRIVFPKETSQTNQVTITKELEIIRSEFWKKLIK